MAFGQNQDNVSDAIIALAQEHVQTQDGYSIKSVEGLLTTKDANHVIVFNLNPQGFVIIQSKKLDIIGFSFDNNFAAIGTEERELSLDLLQFTASQDFISDKTVNDIDDQMWGPYVYNMWGQVNCSDNTGHTINVNNLFTPNNYAPGCVAVSQSSILKHYNWPPRGMGTSSYTDNSGSSTGHYSVDPENTYYDWPNALDRYRGKSSEMVEREAAGTVTYHSAVSLSMNFEFNGSTSNVNRIPSALAKHFRFTALYKSRGTGSFWAILDSNMVWAKPAVLAVENSSGGGHSVVCDGLKIENGNYFYHLNMGWWGTSNGWYKIRNSFNAGGYNYVIGAAMNIIAEPYITPPVVLDNSPMTQLSWTYPENAHAEAFEIQRSINGGSWETITTTVSDTSLTIFPDEESTYEYRARAQVNNGLWYSNSWSDKVKLIRTYTGVEEEEELNKVNVFPNPIQDKLYIQIASTAKSNIIIYNELGQLIYQKDLNNTDQIELNTESWKKGIYFIQIWNNNTSRTIKSVKL
jgi:hypothetical protein